MDFPKEPVCLVFFFNALLVYNAPIKTTQSREIFIPK